MEAVTSLWFSLPCLMAGAFLVWVVYRVQLQMRRNFHNPSYQLGMVMATAIISLSAGLFSIFGKLVLP
jgi:hypothetical protein